MDKPQVFNDVDLSKMRKYLEDMRTPGAYEPGRWNVSKYNRDPAIVDSLPREVQLRDITLRTMEQMFGVAPSPEQRLDLLRAIAETGVPSIEPSAFRRGHDEHMADEAALIHEINPDCELVYGGVSSEAEIELAARTGYDAVEVWSTYLGGAAPATAGATYHRAWADKEWRTLRFPNRPEDQIERSLKFIELARRHGIEIIGTVNLLALCDASYVELYAREVGAAGAREITLADGSSGVGPEAFAHFTGIVKGAAPECVVGIHTHDVFGLAMSNVLACLKAGATMIEVAVNEYEEHAGQPDLATASAALEAIYGINTGIDLTKLTPLARLAEEITGYSVQWNHTVTGRHAFASGGGDEYVQQRFVDPLIHNAITPETVGGHHTDEISLLSGPFSMWDKLVELGFEVPGKVAVDSVLAECKRMLGDVNRGLNDEDVFKIASQTLSDA